MTQQDFENYSNTSSNSSPNESEPLANKLNVNLPQQVAKLLGRDEVVEQITNALMASESVHMQLVGIGGMGKTAICRYVAHHLADDFGDVVWINCQASLMEQLRNYVTPRYHVKVEDPTTWLYELIEVMNNRPKPMVVFLDNLEFEDVTSAEFRQLKSLNCHMVATSRQAFSDQFTRAIDVSSLHKKQCRELFVDYYQGDIDNEESLQKLLALAGYHTLTIELLAKIATSGLFSVEDLLEKVIESGFDLSDWDIAVTGEHSGQQYEHKGQLQLQEHLSKLFRLDNLSESQQQALYYLSILPPIAYEGREELVKWLGVEGTLLTGLADKGWLQRNKNKFSLHPVIASVARCDVKFDESLVFEFISRVNEDIEPDENQHWVEKAHYLSQLEAINHYLDTLNINDMELDAYDIAKADIMCSEASIHLVFINYDKAIKFYNLALSLYHHVYGKNHNKTSICINDLAFVLLQKGDNRQALKLFKQCLAIDMEINGPGHINTATRLNNIAGIHRRQENYDEALKHYLKVYDIVQKQLADDDPRLAISLNNIGSVYFAKKQYQQALDYSNKALKIRQNVLNPLNPDLASSCLNLASTYFQLNELQPALNLILKARFIYAKSLVDEHPDNKNCQAWLDQIVTALGGYEQNEALIEQIEAKLDKEYDGVELGRDE